MTTLMIRRWHTYIGLLISPSVIFFSLTGAAQLFHFHEAHGDYHPPALMEKLSALHKDQVFSQPRAHKAEVTEHSIAAEAHSDAKKGSVEDEQTQERTGTLVLKWFFLVVALGLCVSSCLGIYLGLTQSRRKFLSWLAFAAGCFIPVTFLLLS